MIEAPSTGESPTIVVTGASGLLGRHVCTHFSHRGWQVRALARNPESLAEVLPDTVTGTCDLPESLDESLLVGAQVLVHCAYATRAKSVAEARPVNEEGTRRVLEASRSAGIPRFVFISSLSAHPAAPSYYARSKFELEGLTEPSVDLVVRPGLILAREGAGLFQRLRDSMKATRVVPLFGGGTQPLQTVYVGDLCEALERALIKHLTGILRVAESEPMALGTFLRTMADRLALRCLFVPLPYGPLLATLRMIEAVRLPFPLSAENLRGLQSLRAADVTEDLRRLDLEVKTARESLTLVL